MAYSRVTQLGNGSTNTFSVNFPLGIIDDVPAAQFNITCHVGDELVPRTINWVSENIAEISGAPPGDGVPVVFDRTVTKTVLISDFEDNAVFIDTALNNASKQAIMIAMEALDGRIGPCVVPIDMGGNKITNLGSGTAPTDAINRQDALDIAASIPIGPQGPVGPPGANGVVLSIEPGTGIGVDDTDPAHPIISVVGAGGDTNVYQVNTLTDLKAVDTSQYTCVLVRNPLYGGIFYWTVFDFTSYVATDPLEGVYVKSTPTAVSVGMWAREGFNPTITHTSKDTVESRWFGVRGDSNGTTGNGTDNTAALAAAIAFSIAWRIPYVKVPRGIVRTTNTVTISDASIRLIGSGMGLPDDSPNPVNVNKSTGTWLYFDHVNIGMHFTSTGGDSSTSPRYASVVAHLTTLRNQPTPASGWAPTSSGADFRCAAHIVHFDDVGVFNPWIAFSLWRAPCSFNHIRGQPLRTFCAVDQTLDVVRWHDIHLWPYWSLSDFVTAYTRVNVVCFDLGRCDNPQLSNVFSIRQNTGIRITDGAGGGTTRLKATNCEFDSGGHGLVVGGDTSNLIIQLVNFVVFCDATYANGTRGIWIDGSGHNIHIVNTDISNTGSQAILVAGSNHRVAVHNYRLYNYGRFTANAPGIQTVSTNSIVYLSGAEYLSAPNSTVRISASGTGNSILRTTMAAAT